ncbi:MAG: ligase-associated DNA damage response exonuclease [Cryobacterium sp.]|nr:ligase-associated DNA damage response exonuclease [Oligoflexia bacterium]
MPEEAKPNQSELVVLAKDGLYCEAGGFYIDPWGSVETGIITHGHGDHAHIGSQHYYASRSSLGILKTRMGEETPITTLAYGKVIRLGETEVSLHPAGHILGSAQVRIAHAGQVWVVSGDYKRDPDPTCAPFEVVECDTFVTEATFASPVYHWPPIENVVREIHDWWMQNRARGQNSILCAYSLGKVQRVLAELMRFTNEPVHLHGSATRLVQVYRDEGVSMAPTIPVSELDKKEKLKGALIIAPPSASGSTWTRRFEPYEVGFASGWMQIRGNRRRKAYDRGFIVSDHADWPSLLRTIEETKAKRIIATHGSSDILARYVREEMGKEGITFETQFGEEDE